MTAVHNSSRPPASLIAYNPLPSQNTAPVLEYRCLYTHDLRRKQKRWQDGFCNFHTFNKRLMLYDVSRNYLGDTHWQDAETPTSGDEISFEQSAVLVQIEDQIATSRTDLTPLFERRSRGSVCDATQQSPLQRTTVVRDKPLSRLMPSSVASKHRSLSDMLAKSKGRIAISVQSVSTHSKGHGQEPTSGDDACARKRRRSTKMAQPADSPQPDAADLQNSADADFDQLRQASKIAEVPVRNRSSTYVDLTKEYASSDGLPSEVTALGSAITSPATSPAPLRLVSTKSNSPVHSRKPYRKKTTRQAEKSVVYDQDADHAPESHAQAGKKTEKPMLGRRETGVEPRPLAKPLRLVKAAPRSMLLCGKANPQSLSLTSAEAESGNGPAIRDEHATLPHQAPEQEFRRPTKSSLRQKRNDAVEITMRTGLVPKGPFSANTRSVEERQRNPILPDYSLQGLDAILLANGQTDKQYHGHRSSKRLVQVEPQTITAAGSELSPSITRPFRRIRSENDACLDHTTEKTDEYTQYDVDMSLGISTLREMATEDTPSRASLVTRREKGRGLHRIGSEAQISSKRPSGAENTGTTVGINDQGLRVKSVGTEIGPWTVEAMDLFDWRPPDWAQRRTPS